MSYIIKGQIEVDADRGVIYFHADASEVKGNGCQPTPMRISGLKRPIQDVRQVQVDINVGDLKHDEREQKYSGQPDHFINRASKPL